MKPKKHYALLALVLCLCCVMGGPVRPLMAFAAVNLDLNMNSSEPASAQQAVQAVEAASSNESRYRTEIDKINDKLEDLQKEKQEIEKSIQATKNQKDKEQANKNYLDRQITITKDEITNLLERVSVLEAQIEETQGEIEEKQASIDLHYEQFKKRLRTMYMYGETSTLELILGAASFSDFLSKTEMVVRIAEHDRILMQNITAERIGLEESQQAMQEAKTQLEQDKNDVEGKKRTLDQHITAASLKIQDMEEMERQFRKDLAQNQAEQAAMQKELDSIYQQIEWDKNPYVGGEMAWPVPGYYKITSEYGWRFNGTDYHTGMDIAGTGVYGKPIVAANAGTVRFVNWKYTAGKGYGIYLIVDHGGGMSTLYGHCSNIVVKVGDVVKKGQKIAEVGSTGWSTGPHLHFEVRVDGKHTNPKPYVIGGSK